MPKLNFLRPGARLEHMSGLSVVSGPLRRFDFSARGGRFAAIPMFRGDWKRRGQLFAAALFRGWWAGKSNAGGFYWLIDVICVDSPIYPGGAATSCFLLFCCDSRHYLFAGLRPAVCAISGPQRVQVAHGPCSGAHRHVRCENWWSHGLSLRPRDQSSMETRSYPSERKLTGTFRVPHC